MEQSSNINVRFLRLTPSAQAPHKAHITDAGFDLTADSFTIDENGCRVYGTGIAVEIPQGYVGLLFPRSSISKHHMLLCNSVGVIDSGYRGEIKFKFEPTAHTYTPKTLMGRLKVLFTGKVKGSILVNRISSYFDYQVGDRIGQLIIMPYPSVTFFEATSLSDSDRGTDGFGSTGK